MKIMKKYLSMIVASLLAVACVDTQILPNDKTVEEDFWKSKSDVQLMVNGAYQAMLSENVIARLIIWGELRSEEVVPVSSVVSTLQEDLAEINLANTKTDNQFASWADLYAVINRCNLVLDKAAQVMSEDPSYTEGDYLADCSQMLALRALCYFYLVRNFRDVPYITSSYTDSSQDRNVPQSAPDAVLSGCIADLETAEKNAISAGAYTDWRRVGYLTRDGIDALLADIYLWRASIKHDAADYEKVIEYCDKVIASKKSQHVKQRNEVEDKEYWLADGRSAFSVLYITPQNAEESIYELQFQSGTNANNAILHYYNHYNGGSGQAPYLFASSILGYGKEAFQTGPSKITTDWRGLMDTYNEQKTAGDFDVFEIRKFVSENAAYSPSRTTDKADTKANYTNASTNFIIYRLTDVMLMKAEALTALATDDDDVERLHAAFDLVYEVNLRSMDTDNMSDDALKWGSYSGAGSMGYMEELILQERLREFCFEGKRWYDLLRYSFRHTEGIDYSTTLAQQADNEATFPKTYNEMLTLMKRKLAGKGNAVAAKLTTEPALYMPIPESDINVCPILRQNPNYSNIDNINKNY
jgi:hypothetical protein